MTIAIPIILEEESDNSDNDNYQILTDKEEENLIKNHSDNENEPLIKEDEEC
ncbi:15263_t:CDS:2 [Funneliformis mosseae]|uniref:15263_t:CDS:1 n=1 Tax=Funneliformis mosseae TaxID=27381 RepID=A0A9N8ZT41_FUNMO|nr:15263_t:CDS:2 [Funneliformis mosseae]